MQRASLVRSAAALALAAAALVPIAASDVSDAAVAPAPAARPVASPATTVSLVSGQQVRLDQAADGRMTATQLGARRAGDPRLLILGRADHGTRTITATPAPALGLVASGAVDGRLFDLGYLAAHGLAGGAVPVSVRFATAQSAATTARSAQALPGATYVAGSATADRATVRVDPAAAGAFWSAVTRVPAADPTTVTGKPLAGNPDAPRVLAAGIAGLSLAGAPPASVPAAAPADYTLTVQVHGFSDRSRWIYTSEVFELEFAYLLGVTGPDAGTPLYPAAVTCNQAATCDTLLLTFRAPAGVYSFGSAYTVGGDGRFGTMLGYRPEVDLDSDLTITLDADESSYTTFDGPRPSEPTYYTATEVRNLPDGEQISDLIGLGTNETAYNAGAWVIPAPRVRTGSFHLELNLIAQQPLLRAAVVGHPDLALSPLYQAGTGTADELVNEATRPYYRFPAGTHAYGVVDVGYGSDKDFARADVAGQLALIHINPNVQRYGCSATFGPLYRAIAARAAGVVYDPTNPRVGNVLGCVTPFDGEWIHYPAKAEPDIPWMTVLPSQAQAIEALLRDGPVSLSITGVDTVSYLYEASANFSGGIPTHVGQRLTDANSIAHVSAIHSTGPATPVLVPTGSRPGDNFLYAPEFGNWRSDGVPYTVAERLGPTAPDYYYNHTWSDAQSSFYYAEHIAMDGSYPARTDYNEQPQTFGAARPSPRLERLVPLLGSVYCAFCRQGDTLYPILVGTSGAAPQLLTPGSYFPTARLTRDGVPIPLDTGGLPAYDLPSTPGDYVFSASGSDVALRWAFHSDPPTKTTRPIGTICLGTAAGVSTAPCAASPLVFVRYAAPVDRRNTAPSGGPQTISVTGYHQDPAAAPIVRLTVAVSFDGGTTWTPAHMTGSAGSYTAGFDVPALADTDGAVSLRVSAADADGNSTQQTYVDAYGLR